MASNNTTAPTTRCVHMADNHRECPEKCQEDKKENVRSGAFHHVKKRQCVGDTEVETGIEVKPPKVKPVTLVAQEATEVETKTKSDEEVEHFYDTSRGPQKFKKTEDKTE